MTKKVMFAVFAGAVALFGATNANAKEYVDYTYAKGIWAITQVEVDPNHIDEYITGLKQTQLPGFEAMKKHGIIDDYYTTVKNGYSEGKPNVVIGVHYVNAEGLMPDAARDQMIDKEVQATMSEAAGKAAIAGYEKYRKFLDSSTWLDIDFKK